MARILVPKPLYGVDRVSHLPNSYTIKKQDRDMNILETYTVFMVNPESLRGATCDCFAGLMHKECRHKKMVALFIKERRVGTHWLFNYDRNRWEEP